MILSNGPPGSSLKALYFIFQLYVKSMASKINCQSSTTSFVTLQWTQILSLSFFCFLLFLRWKIESTSHDPSSSSPSSFLSVTIRTADFKIDPCHPDDFHFNLFLHLMEGRPFAPGNHSCVSLWMMINWRAAVNNDKKKSLKKEGFYKLPFYSHWHSCNTVRLNHGSMFSTESHVA